MMSLVTLRAKPCPIQKSCQYCKIAPSLIDETTGVCNEFVWSNYTCMLSLKAYSTPPQSFYDGFKTMDNMDVYKRLRDDPVFFCQVIFGITPYSYQQKLLRAKSRRIVACWGRQSGKTWCIAWRVIHYAFCNSKRNILIVSKGLRQSMLMYSVISQHILDNAILRKCVQRYTRTEIQLKNGSKIIALPCSSDGNNLRGYTAHMVIMDEAAFMPESVITQVIFPMLATTNGAAIMLSTPWGRSHIFYRSFTDPNFWIQRVKSSECPLISEEFLMEQHRLIGDLRYRIEYEAEFMEDATALFTQDMIRSAIEMWSDQHVMLTENNIKAFKIKQRGAFVLGCDLGKRLDHSVIVILKRERTTVLSEEFGRPVKLTIWRLIFKKQFPLKTRLTMVARYIKWLAKKFEFNAGCIDQTGLGEAVVEDVQIDLPWIDGIPLYGAQNKQNVVMFTYRRLEQHKLCLPNDKELITQMNEQCFGYSAVKTKIIMEEKGVMVFWHPEGRHDDQLWALMLGVYATRGRPSKGQMG